MYMAIDLPHDRVVNAQLIGKILTAVTDVCMFQLPWYGNDIIYSSYKVLILKMRPTSLLKCLCSSIIITATLGLPDLIGQLPVPFNLKSFYKFTTILYYIVYNSRAHLMN